MFRLVWASLFVLLHKWQKLNVSNVYLLLFILLASYVNCLSITLAYQYELLINYFKLAISVFFPLLLPCYFNHLTITFS